MRDKNHFILPILFGNEVEMILIHVFYFHGSTILITLHRLFFFEFLEDKRFCEIAPSTFS